MDHIDKAFAMIVGSQLAIRNMIPEEKRETFYESIDKYKKATALTVTKKSNQIQDTTEGSEYEDKPVNY